MTKIMGFGYLKVSTLSNKATLSALTVKRHTPVVSKAEFHARSEKASALIEEIYHLIISAGLFAYAPEFIRVAAIIRHHLPALVWNVGYRLGQPIKRLDPVFSLDSVQHLGYTQTSGWTSDHLTNLSAFIEKASLRKRKGAKVCSPVQGRHQHIFFSCLEADANTLPGIEGGG